jgi:hypothetical protein
MFSFLRLLRMSLWVGTACAVVGLAVAAADEPPDKKSLTEPRDFFPRQKYQALPGKVVGVLAAGGQSVLRAEGRKGPPDALYLGVGSGSYRLIYVPVKKKPVIGAMLVPVGDKGKPKRFDSLSLANPETVKQWGLTAPYTLVEVEVNGGLGSPANGSLVATRMRAVEGTTEYPLRVADLVEQLRRQYGSWAAEQDKLIQTEMIEAQQKFLRDQKPTGPREKEELLHVTWLPENQRLRIRFQTRLSDGSYRYSTIPSKVEKNRRIFTDIRYGTSFGVELGMTYEVSKTGKVEQSQELPVQMFHKEIRRPPEDPGDRPRGSKD